MHRQALCCCCYFRAQGVERGNAVGTGNLVRLEVESQL